MAPGNCSNHTGYRAIYSSGQMHFQCSEDAFPSLYESDELLVTGKEQEWLILAWLTFPDKRTTLKVSVISFKQTATGLV